MWHINCNIPIVRWWFGVPVVKFNALTPAMLRFVVSVLNVCVWRFVVKGTYVVHCGICDKIYIWRVVSGNKQVIKCTCGALWSWSQLAVLFGSGSSSFAPNQSINQPTKQSINQLTNQSINQPTNQSINRINRYKSIHQ